MYLLGKAEKINLPLDGFNAMKISEQYWKKLKHRDVLAYVNARVSYSNDRMIEIRYEPMA